MDFFPIIITHTHKKTALDEEKARPKQNADIAFPVWISRNVLIPIDLIILPFSFSAPLMIKICHFYESCFSAVVLLKAF